MTTKHALIANDHATSNSPQRSWIRSVFGLVVLASCLVGNSARAENVLKDVTFAPGPGGQVDVTMTLDAPPADPKLFATESPARIAVDFENTRNAVAQKRLPIGVGAASAVSAVEAAGRTRVVIELFHTAGYSTRAVGNSLIVTINGAGSVTSASASDDPTKHTAGGRTEISGVDFRRGKNGEGRVIVSFAGSGATVDLDKQGSKVVLAIGNASLPESLARKLDVTDFATPALSVETRAKPGGARMEIATNGAFESLAYQTGSEYVVEIAPAKVESAAAKALKEPEYNGERVTFNFQDIPVRSVLQLIADVSQLNVVVADSVSGNVTLRLVNVPWDQALDIILQAKGLDKRKRGNVLWIAPTKDIAEREQALEDARIAIEDREPLISENIAINYGKAKDIAKLLTTDALRSTQGQGAGGAAPAGGGAGGAGSGGANSQQRSGFLSPRGSVTFDERTNTLLLSDIPARIASLKQLISLLDRAVDQVLIEARIVLANESFGKELGARFGISGAVNDSNGNIITTGGSVSATDQVLNDALTNRLNGTSTGLPVGLPSLSNRLNVNLPASSSAARIALGILGANHVLDLELSAMEQEGRGQVISSPRVITATQQEAVITQKDDFGYRTTNDAGTSGRLVQTVVFKELFLQLKVTPIITQDKRINLDMLVRKDELKSILTLVNGDQIPQFTERELKTSLLVENGQTVVLGGVYEFNSRKDLTKVPFLGDLPVLGNLFKNRNNSTSKAELMIFVTPKILGEGGR